MPISDLELGKLVAHVDACNNNIDKLTKKIDKLETQLDRVNAVMSKGKGLFAGAILVAGALGAGGAKFFGLIGGE